MGRHDLTLEAALKGCSSLLTGLCASTPVPTPTGWVEISALSAGDIVVTRDHGHMPILTIAVEERAALWAVLFPEGTFDNKAEVMLPPGQPVLVQTAHRSCETRTLVPAASLEGWRGITAFIPPSRETILQLRLSRPGLVEVGPGLMIGVKGRDTGAVDLTRRFLHAPEHPVLPFAAARQLTAVLVASDVGRGLWAADQAALLPTKRV